MNNQSLFLLILCLVLIAGACKSPAGISKKTSRKNSPEALMAQMTRNQFKADWFSAKLQIDYSDKYTSVGASSNLRMKKDSLIWMNVKKLGFELARVQITTDSIYVLDRINNEYIAEDLQYLAREYNIPASLATLQAIILGNPVFFSTRDMKMENRELSYHLYSSDTRMENHYWLDIAKLLLRKMSINELASDRTVELELDGYEQMSDKQNFSYIRKLKLNSPDTGNMDVALKFSKVEINVPKSIKFEIPDRYTRTD